MRFLNRFSLSLAAFGLLFLQQNVQAAQSFLIADGESGYILAEGQSREKRQVGSLTKIATAMVVLDWSAKKSGDLNQSATIPPDAFTGTNENNIGFQPGDRLTLRDLLYAALVQSDNVAAYTLADHVGHTLDASIPVNAQMKNPAVIAFVSQMNALAKNLRMERTRFLNPAGLDSTEQPFSTAADMARLARYAMSKPGFRFYVSQKERQISFQRGGKKLAYKLRNTNELLGRDGVDGVKTGSTARAGDCLILSSSREAQVEKRGTTTFVTPRHLIIVLLGSPDRFGEGEKFLAQGWQLYDQWAAAGRRPDPHKTL